VLKQKIKAVVVLRVQLKEVLMQYPTSERSLGKSGREEFHRTAAEIHSRYLKTSFCQKEYFVSATATRNDRVPRRNIFLLPQLDKRRSCFPEVPVQVIRFIMALPVFL
jgi:hypothetical protein